MLGLAAMALAVMRYHKKKWLVITYTSILFTLALMFIGVAVMVPGKTTKVHDQIYYNCTSDPLALIHVVDTVYDTANLQVCGASCHCYANQSEWKVTGANTKENPLGSLESVAAKMFMTQNEKDAHKYQDCPLAQAVFSE